MKGLNCTTIFLPILGTLALFACVNNASGATDPHVSFVPPTTEESSSAPASEKRVITTLAKDIEESIEFGTGGRSKRQVDSSTAVVGLRIMQGVEAEDYTRVKNTARRVERSTRGGRSRRSVDGHFDAEKSVQYGEHAVSRILHLPHQILNSFKGRNHQNKRPRPTKPTGPSRPPPTVFRIEKVPVSPPIHFHEHHEHQIFLPVYVPRPPAGVVGQPRVPIRIVPAAAPVIRPPPLPALPPATTTQVSRRTFLTRTQQVFDIINYNVTLASRLRDEYVVQSLKDLSGSSGYVDTNRMNANQRLIVVDPSGITCQDVCDTTQTYGTGYGTLGICTPNFCQCDFSLWQFTRYHCPGDTVFDPLLKVCNDPRRVILCNDENVEEEPVGGYGAGPTAPAGGYSNNVNNNNNNIAGGYGGGNNNHHSPTSAAAAAVLLAALTPANTKLIQPVPNHHGPQTTLNNNHLGSAALPTPPLNIPSGGYNNGYDKQLVVESLLNKFSPEQLQIFAALLSHKPSSTYSTNFAGHVNQIFAQSTQSSPAQYGAPLTAPSTQYGAPSAPSNQYGVTSGAANQQSRSTQDPTQFEFAPSKEVFSYSQAEPSNQYSAPSDKDFVTHITSTAQPHLNIPGLVPPLAKGMESVYGQGTSHQGSSSSAIDYQQHIGHLTPEQIKQLTEIAKQFAAQNSLTSASKSGQNSYGR